MSTVQGRLRIAVQKSGRLSDRSLDLVRDAGLRVVKGNNDLLYRVENYPTSRPSSRTASATSASSARMCWRRSATAAPIPDILGQRC
jgi:hypothetical protein